MNKIQRTISSILSKLAKMAKNFTKQVSKSSIGQTVVKKTQQGITTFKKFDRKKKLLTIGIFTVFLGTVSYFVKINGNNINNQDRMMVSAEVAKIGTINIKAKFAGKIRTAESVTLTSEVVGKIVYMKADGAVVQKGDLILELDSTEAEGRYMVALGRKNEEETKLKVVQNLYKEGYRTETHLKEQQAKFQSAQGQLLEATANLNKHKIRAPFKGIIGLHNQSLGATVNQHSKLITITNFGNLQVEFLVSEAELRALGGIDKIKAATFFVTLDGHVLPIPAEYAAHETVLDLETHAIAVRATLKPAEGDANAVPGQICNVVLNIGTKEDVLTIPGIAIETTHDAHYVYKVVNGIAVQSGIKIGAKDDEGNVEIIAGLQEGDVVITSDHHRLYDGQSVKVEEEVQK